MSTQITKLGCLWIVLVIGIFSIFSIPKVKAGWGRLVDAGESINIDGATVHVVYDKQQKVDCYVVVSAQLAFNENRSNSIHCMKVGQ